MQVLHGQATEWCVESTDAADVSGKHLDLALTFRVYVSFWGLVKLKLKRMVDLVEGMTLSFAALLDNIVPGFNY